jgi:biotin operon repressor
MTNVRYEILDALYEGETLSTETLRSTFGVTNVAARVHELRNAGYAIYTNRNGYRLGRASERYLRNLNAGRTQLARRSLYTRAA